MADIKPFISISEMKIYGTSKTAEELESYIYGLTCAVDVVEKYVDKENVE